ncbi:MAG: TMEM165/GDT1 family protein [Kiritimatiellaeota bacterium]|nr:TMEM165/GDT1 family protein [Kiritimatiellota bacterium]
MLNFKVLMASFALVFLAELGDKTQLTALAFSASSRSPWSVFLGTSLALVCASALAVLLGGVLAAHVPEKAIQILAAVMFIAVGVVLLVNVARRAPSAADRSGASVVQAPQTGPASLAYRLVIRQARRFEEDTAELFRCLAAAAPAGRLRETLEQIARDELEHGISLHQADGMAGEVDSSALVTGRADAGEGVIVPEPPAWTAGSADGCNEVVRAERSSCHELLERALTAEEGAAGFYLSLSRLSGLPALRQAFRRLAAAELRHIEQLTVLLEDVHGGSDDTSS